MWYVYSVEFNLSVRKIKSRNFQVGTRKYHTEEGNPDPERQMFFLI